MGRIKTKIVKRVTQQLIDEHKDTFSEDFVKNKELIKEFVDINSRKLSNIVAGYITKLVKLEKNQK
ncbi:30S ribosomal protein S17e [Candidatus Woesearchaeota archaeon]|nr:30S ribosomal protein S17e [Candidatus Woesearchaeota archaeon]|tara:strand:+ start:35727 stop:35924 length:198 start_codon:yes stop_codon:yes gene_type:complete